MLNNTLRTFCYLGLLLVTVSCAPKNGAPGRDGTTPLITTTPDPALCSGAGGTLVTIGTDLNQNGTLEFSEIKNTVQVCNGRPATEALLINPCGSEGAHDEILIVLPDGNVLASFSDTTGGSFTRLTLLVDGANYMTTDGKGCHFSLYTAGGMRHYLDESGLEISWSI